MGPYRKFAPDARAPFAQLWRGIRVHRTGFSRTGTRQRPVRLQSGLDPAVQRPRTRHIGWVRGGQPFTRLYGGGANRLERQLLSYVALSRLVRARRLEAIGKTDAQPGVAI